jgi:hypothetical protein
MTTLKVIQKTFAVGFWALIVVFLILFGLQFLHDPLLDNFGLLIQLHKYFNPLIALVGSLFGLHWPSSSKSVLPIVACVVVWGIKILVDGILDQVHRVLTKEKPRPRLITDERQTAVGSADYRKGRQDPPKTL